MVQAQRKFIEMLGYYDGGVRGWTTWTTYSDVFAVDGVRVVFFDYGVYIRSDAAFRCVVGNMGDVAR